MEGARRLRPNWPSSSSGSCNGGGRASRAHARQTAATFRSQRQGYRRDSPHLKAGPASGLPWRGLWSPTGHSPQPVSWTTQLTRWPKARWARGHREKAGIHLLPHSPPQDHSSADGWLNGSLTVALWQLFIVGGAQCKTDQWLSRTTNRRCWTVIRLGEGPTVEADQWKVGSNRQVPNFSRFSSVTDSPAFSLQFEKLPLSNWIPHFILNVFYTITAKLISLPVFEHVQWQLSPKRAQVIFKFSN